MKKNLLGLVAIPLIAIGGLTYADDAFLQKEPVNEYIKYSYDTDDGKNIPVITVYGTGIDGNMYGVTIKATNEGTTTAGTGNESYGYYFQWGNNHGNNGTSETTGNLLPIDDLANWANKGYSGTETRFIQKYNANYDYWSGLDNYDETGAIQHSLWGGSGDNETIDGVVKGYNTGTHQVTNLAGRQGPCESGYHVPSAGEWQELVKLYAKANGYDLNTQNGEYAWANTISQGTAFSNDLLLPLAGGRSYGDGEVYNTGSSAYYWSSSPRGGSSPNYAWYLRFSSSYVTPSSYDYRANGQSVRCFKNSYVEPPQTLAFFTVTVDVSPAEGGSASSGSIEAVSGSSITGTIEAGTGFIKSGDVVLSTVTPNPGYIFSGWTTDCGETLTANCTFTGEFKEILYEVEFTGNNVSTGKVEVTSGTEVALTGNGIASSDSKDGYVFIGWNTDSGANEGLSNITVTGNIILYSIFKPITYKVSYDANGGIGSIASSGYTYDLSGNLAENTFTKTGYVFSGWMYNNEIYTGNQEIKNLTGINGATITMVTQWAPIKYSVEFTGTDVSGTMLNQDFTYDVTGSLTANEFTKTGYIFSGWTDGTTGYTDGQNVNNLTTTDGAIVTLTAQWTPITYSIEFTGTDVSGTMANQDFEYDSGQALNANAFTKTGYIFSGWIYGNTGYANQAEVLNLTGTSGAVLQFIAQWTPITYSIEFTGTDVSGTMANQEFTYGEAKALTANAFTKTGYIFSGWIYGDTGYVDQAEVLNLTGTSGAVLTFTADWTPITYTISFSGNAADATGTAPATINAKYDSGDIAPDNSFTLTGYTFTGWNTESDGSGTGYATGAELKNLTTTSGKDVKLYAQWEVNVHKLNFVVDGTNIQSGDVAYSSGISAFLPSEPKKDCNSFAGWTSSVEGLTTTGTMPDSDVTFTANWNYTCSRSSGGGGGGSSRSSSNTEKTTETQTGSKVDSSTKATDNEDNTQDSSAKASEGQNQGKTYSDEFQQAYEFAYKHGITTMPTIEQANMEGPLTRIAMAKMLSYYAINVLGLKPDETRVNKFNDVSDQMDAEYNNAVILAYQLGIMGINMPKNNFRPNDLVTRGEFATALSRMLYKIADGKDKYYSTHLAKLMEEKIITNNNSDLQELRGYVMIMLMRSAK